MDERNRSVRDLRFLLRWGWGLLSCGMWRRVVWWKFTDFSRWMKILLQKSVNLCQCTRCHMTETGDFQERNKRTEWKQEWERTKVRDRKKDGRKKETKKERRKERTYRDASVVPPLPSLFRLLVQYLDIPDASQLFAFKKSSRFDAKCENPAVSDPEVKNTK